MGKSHIVTKNKVPITILLVCGELADYKTFSTKGFVDSIKSFWPADDLLSKYLSFSGTGLNCHNPLRP